MNHTFFNYLHHQAESRWQRSDFARIWWQFYAQDRRWTPPYYPAWRKALEPRLNPHLARLKHLIIHTTATRRPNRARINAWQPGGLEELAEGILFDVPMAAAILLGDARLRTPNMSHGRPAHGRPAAYLADLHAVNEPDSLELLFYHLGEAAAEAGYGALEGPTGLSPYLYSGVLQNLWNENPPLHCAYQPPFLPEILDALMDPVEPEACVYRLEIPVGEEELVPGKAELVPFGPHRLARDLLPLLQTACVPWRRQPPPDQLEASFILEQITFPALQGILALVGGQPVGFVLLQPDITAAMQRSSGGRRLAWRAWLHWAAKRPSREGRIPFGGVLPQWRGQQIGRQLLYAAQEAARQQGWQALHFGPLPEGSPGAAFLAASSAECRQRYRLYRWGSTQVL